MLGDFRWRIYACASQKISLGFCRKSKPVASDVKVVLFGKPFRRNQHFEIEVFGEKNDSLRLIYRRDAFSQKFFEILAGVSGCPC